MASIKSNSLDLDRLTALKLLPVLMAGDERTDIESPDRNCFGRFSSRWNAGAIVVWNLVGGVHPVSFVNFVDHVYVRQMLDPVSAIVSGNDQPQRITIQPRQSFAIHFEREHHFAIHGMVHIE